MLCKTGQVCKNVEVVTEYLHSWLGVLDHDGACGGADDPMQQRRRELVVDGLVYYDGVGQ